MADCPFVADCPFLPIHLVRELHGLGKAPCFSDEHGECPVYRRCKDDPEPRLCLEREWRIFRKTLSLIIS